MRKKNPTAALTDGPIGPALVRLSVPMLVGILSMMAFNLVDTYFVSRMGTVALAAMALTFPVVMVIGTFTLGLGVGAMAVISQGIGRGRTTDIRRSATDALTLAGLCAVVLTVAGIASVEPLFRMLGATDEMMPYVRQYMLVWYPGIMFYVVPIIGNNIIRATGDTLTPSIVMVFGVVLNAVLDPVFIFGAGSIPAMGMAGAALATVLARAVTLALALWVLAFRERMLASPWPGRRVLVASWKDLLRLGLPVAVSNAIIPIAVGLLTRIVSGFGAETIAGFGVASRIEGFGMAVVYAVSSGVSPFVGQNFGAGRMDRIHKGLNMARVFCVAWGGTLFVAFLTLGKPLARCFNDEPTVIEAATLYLWIVSVSLGLRSIHQVVWTSLNVLNRPYDAMALEMLLAFGLWIPLAFLGARVAQIKGLYVGLALANALAGAAACIWVDRVIRQKRNQCDREPHKDVRPRTGADL